MASDLCRMACKCSSTHTITIILEAVFEIQLVFYFNNSWRKGGGLGILIRSWIASPPPSLIGFEEPGLFSIYVFALVGPGDQQLYFNQYSLFIFHLSRYSPGEEVKKLGGGAYTQGQRLCNNREYASGLSARFDS